MLKLLNNALKMSMQLNFETTLAVSMQDFYIMSEIHIKNTLLKMIGFGKIFYANAHFEFTTDNIYHR